MSEESDPGQSSPVIETAYISILGEYVCIVYDEHTSGQHA